MMDQLDIFATDLSEEEVYNILLPSLMNALQESNAGQENIKLETGKSYSSVSYLKQDPYDPRKEKTEQLAFRVCCRNKKYYFGISNTYVDYIPEKFLSMTTTAGKSAGYTNFSFKPTLEGIEEYTQLLSQILELVTYSSVKEFDCCSRFEECSNAKRCIHPFPGMATSCGYRKSLKAGKVYYGNTSITY